MAHLITSNRIQERGNSLVEEVQEWGKIYNDGSSKRLDVMLLEDGQNLWGDERD